MPKAVADSVAARYWALTKPRVVALIVFTAVIGMFLATPDLPGWRPLLLGSLGIWLAAASAAAINHLLDSRIDAVMVRTAHRPLPSGTLNARQVLVFAVVLGLASMLLLGLGVNALAAGLTFASLIGYAIVYTGWLKRATPQNIVIGGGAGAFPPLIGWVAVTGEVTAMPLLLFAIIFFWTPPHFWALALFVQSDYAKVGIPMLPVVAGEKATRRQIMLYTLLLAPIAIAPWYIGGTGWIYGSVAVVLSVLFVVLAMPVFTRTRAETDAMTPEKTLFKFSIAYLFVLFAALVADRLAAYQGWIA